VFRPCNCTSMQQSMATQHECTSAEKVFLDCVSRYTSVMNAGRCLIRFSANCFMTAACTFLTALMLCPQTTTYSCQIEMHKNTGLLTREKCSINSSTVHTLDGVMQFDCHIKPKLDSEELSYSWETKSYLGAEEP
jgi:hypothetical protein